MSVQKEGLLAVLELLEVGLSAVPELWLEEEPWAAPLEVVQWVWPPGALFLLGLFR